MALQKEKKVEILNKLEDIAKKPTQVFVNFHGLSVEKANELRGRLAEQGIGYFVARKTLLKRAFEKNGPEGQIPELEGEIAVAYSDGDPLAPAQEIWSFHKENKDSIAIVGGVFEEKYMPQSEMLDLAQIPSVHGLRSMFANVIQSPIQRLVVALDQVAQNKN